MEYTYKYPRPAVTADCVVVTKGENPQVLLIERGDEPCKGCWALPGGFMNMDETTEQCAIRELEEETGLKVSEVHQIGAYSKVDRDPRGRTITVAYLALVEHAADVKGRDDAAKAQWFPLNMLPKLAFDHEEIVTDAMKTYLRLECEVPYENFKEMDFAEKIDVMVSTMANVLLEKFQQKSAHGFMLMTFAAARLFANLSMSLGEITKKPHEVVDSAIDMLKLAFQIASCDKRIEMSEEKIAMLKQEMHEIQVKIKRKEQELVGVTSKQKKDGDIN